MGDIVSFLTWLFADAPIPAILRIFFIGFIIGFSVLFFGFNLLCKPGRKDDKGVEEYAKKADDIITFFAVGRKRVRAVLRWLDRRAKDEYSQNYTPAGWRGALGDKHNTPWSAGLYDFTLRLALIYPLLFLLIGWTVNGTTMAGLEAFLPSQPALWKRILATFLMVFIGFSFYRHAKTSGIKSLIWFILAVAGAVAFAFAVAGAGAGAFVFAFTFAFAFAFAFPGAFVFVFAFTFTFAFTFAGASVFAGAFAVAVAVAVAGAGAGAIYFIGKRLDRQGWRLHYLIRFWVFYLAASLLTFYTVPYFIAAPEKVGLQLLLFFVVLPLVNVPLDFLSLGLTRGLVHFSLKQNNTARMALISLGDIIAAFAFMLPLAAMTSFIIGVANWAFIAGGGAEPLLALQDTLSGMRQAPGDPQYYWLWLMLFSTLMPSLVHIGIGLTSLLLTLAAKVVKVPQEVLTFLATDTGKKPHKDSKITRFFVTGALFGGFLIGLISLLVSLFPNQALWPFKQLALVLFAIANGVVNWLSALAGMAL